MSILPPHPLLSHPLFQGTFYEDRRQSSQAKPKIRKLFGMQTWVCHLQGQRQIYGFGLTPALAYRDWKVRVKEQC